LSRNKKCFEFYPLLVSCLLAALLSACAIAPGERAAEGQLPDLFSPIAETPQALLQRARQAQGNAAYDWSLRAAQAYLQQGQAQPALAVVDSLQGAPLTPKQQAEAQLVRAKALQALQNSAAALQTLSFDYLWQLPDSHWQQYYQLRAELLEQLGYPLPAAETRVKLDPYLAPEARQANQTRIWQLLAPLTPFTLNTYKAVDNDPVFAGWVALAALFNEWQHNPVKLAQALEQWQQHYPQHPGLTQLPDDLLSAASSAPFAPQAIAVILPLSGKWQSLGEALQDGLLSAYRRQQQQIRVDFFDSESQPIAALYPQLLADGYELLIGPLLKPHLEALLEVYRGEIPLLALNQPNATPLPINDNLYYFSLSPEEEAIAAADYLWQQGKRHAAVISSQSSVARRYAHSFAERWQQLSDQRPPIQWFGQRSEMQSNVRDLLEVTQSAQRITQLRQLLGRELEAEERSRRDLDGIYLVASATEIGLLKPFVEVTVSPFADPIDLYATSRSFTLTPSDAQKAELQGVMFSDMPLLLEESDIKTEALTLWPQRSLNDQRLFAMGFDAMTLYPQLPQLRHFPEATVSALSGRLGVSPEGVLTRQLSWATYDQGQLKVVDSVND